MSCSAATYSAVTRSAFDTHQRPSFHEDLHAPQPHLPIFKGTQSATTRTTHNAAANTRALSRKARETQLFSVVRHKVRGRREQNPSNARPLQAAERPASPAAHTPHRARRLADDIHAIRGRVHAVGATRSYMSSCDDERTSPIVLPI